MQWDIEHKNLCFAENKLLEGTGCFQEWGKHAIRGSGAEVYSAMYEVLYMSRSTLNDSAKFYIDIKRSFCRNRLIEGKYSLWNVDIGERI